MGVVRSIESNRSGNQSLHFRVLSEWQCKKIISAAKEILERTGVDIYAAEAVELLKKAGCYVDGKRVRIPAFVVEKALSTVPSRVTLCDRNGNRKLFLEGCNSYFGPGPTCPNFSDVETGEKRRAIKQDTANTAIVCDALPNIDFVMSLTMISDCTAELADIHEVHAMLQNTTKPIVGWAFNAENLKAIYDMCIQVAGGLENLQRNPFIAIYSEPTTPLSHSKEALEKLLVTAEYNLPLVYTPGMILGATAPITVAGALATGVADCLTGIIISQLKREGAPVIGAAPGGVMDMLTMQHCYGAPEQILGAAASAEIFRYLNIPSWSTAAVTDSKIVDQQATLESALQVLTVALSGGNLVHDVGFTDGAMTGSLEQLAIGDEIIDMVRRMVYGIEVNDNTLALDVIDEVGPKGQFLGVNHTFSQFKEQVWYPTLLDRRSSSDWEKLGKKTLGERANEKVRTILAEHKPEALPQAIVDKLDSIVAAAEQRVKK